MGRQFAALTLASLAIATTASGPSSASDETSMNSAPTVVHRLGLAFPPIRDEAAIVLVGSMLIGLGAAVLGAA